MDAFGQNLFITGASPHDLAGVEPAVQSAGLGEILVMLLLGGMLLGLTYKLLRAVLSVVLICVVAGAVVAVFSSVAEIVQALADGSLDLAAAFSAAGDMLTRQFGGDSYFGLNTYGLSLALLGGLTTSVWTAGKVMVWMDRHFPRTALWMRSIPGNLARLSPLGSESPVYEADWAYENDHSIDAGIEDDTLQGLPGAPGSTERQAFMRAWSEVEEEERRFEQEVEQEMAAEEVGQERAILAGPSQTAVPSEDAPQEEASPQDESPPDEVIVERITVRRDRA